MQRLPQSRRRRTRTSSRPRLEPMEARMLLATITVTGTGDTIADDGDRHAPRGDHGGQRERGLRRREGGDPGLDRIAFDIPGVGVQTIHASGRPADDHRPGDDRRLHPARGSSQHAGDGQRRRPRSSRSTAAMALAASD